jgi:hypothetical protein
MKQSGHAPEHAGADEIEQALHQKESSNQCCEANERWNAARWDHPIIDLQHEHGAGERQDVECSTEQADAKEGCA